LIMKIVSICGNHPRNLALAKKLSELDCLNQLFVEKREEFNPIPDSRWDKVDRDNFIKHFSNRKESEKILFEENYKLPNNTIFLKTINSKKLIEWLITNNPDIVFLFGASIISKENLKFFPKYTINLHSGIVPKYRGHASGFWSFYYLEPNWSGHSYHLINENIDNGNIIHQSCPLLEKGDNLQTVAAKSAYKAINEINLIINKIKDKKLITFKQQNYGKVYYKNDFNVKYLRLVYNFFDDKIVDLYLKKEISPSKVNVFQIKI
jgi:folate-dependent phosphoribosylglycinamide formyltransferase PurN